MRLGEVPCPWIFYNQFQEYRYSSCSYQIELLQNMNLWNTPAIFCRKKENVFEMLVTEMSGSMTIA